LSDSRNNSAGLRDIFASFAHRPRLLLGAALTVAVYFLTPSHMREPTRLLIAWNAGTYAFLAMILELWVNPKGDARADSRPEDEGQEALLILAVLAGSAALGAIVWELGPVKSMEGWAKTGHLLLVASTILSAWTFIHVMFALHYAGAFYAPTGDGGISGGLKFPNENDPDWTEFAYQAFVIGCAFATADVNVTTAEMRRVVLAQGVVAFFFNTVVVALTINLAAGLF
jgi:uncharacterized membrane protein